MEEEEEEDYISIENIFYDFKDKLSQDIDNSSISMNNKDCYLIKESWCNELVNCFKEYHNNKNKNTDFEEFLPKNDPQFINDFSKIISCLKSNEKMIIVSRELMESIYDKDDLKKCDIIKYYAGNKKLIIKFENDSSNKALLIINPNYIIQKNRNIYIISINNNEKNIYLEELLSLENILNYEIKLNNNYTIISLEKYLNILKLLIYIYYYEKALLDNKEAIFKDNKEYYLINPDWINKIKKYYKDYFKSLKTIKTNSNKINNQNLNKFCNGIISVRNNLNIENNKLFEEILNIKKIGATKDINNKIIYHPNCYIINSEIMNIIKSFFNNNK